MENEVAPEHCLILLHVASIKTAKTRGPRQEDIAPLGCIFREPSFLSLIPSKFRLLAQNVSELYIFVKVCNISVFPNILCLCIKREDKIVMWLWLSILGILKLSTILPNTSFLFTYFNMGHMQNFMMNFNKTKDWALVQNATLAGVGVKLA